MDRNAFGRLCYTVSKYVHAVLRAVMKLHCTFFVVPEAVNEESDDHRWKWFKGCLEAIDDTYINVQGSTRDARVVRDAVNRVNGYRVPKVNTIFAITLADVYADGLGLEAEVENVPGEYIECVEPSNAWTEMQDELAGSMWDAYVNHVI
ncbi:hypothetical protein AAHA92_30902 [Salvia divinorum]|uniref:Uncharacterized protein n=1 Tax=Salvia divinorum TaxID=28513 RepID=A0ABD1FSD6_SALDI